MGQFLLRSPLTWYNSFPIEVQSHSQEHHDAQSEDVGSPSTPPGSAVVAGWSHHRLQQESQDGAEEPHHAVQTPGQAHAEQNWGHVGRLHCIAELPAEHGQAVHDEPAHVSFGWLHGAKVAILS